MKKTFYAFVLLALCCTLGFAADSALHQAHRANAFGIMNGEETDPEKMRSISGLDFDTRNPVAVHGNGKKGPTKSYTYTKPNGTTRKVNFDPNIPQPSEAVDATNETADQKNNSAKTNYQNNAPAKTNTQNNNSVKTNTAKQEPDSEVPYYQQLKEWAAKHKDPNDPNENYGRKKETHLRDYSVEREENIKPQPKPKKVYKYLKPGEENLPTEEKDRLEKSRKQAAKKKAQSEQSPATQEEWVDPITKAKTQAEVREILKKRVLNPEFKQYLKENGVGEDEFIDRLIAGYKEYQRPDYTGPVAKQQEQQKQQDQNDNSEEQAKIQMTQGLRNLCIVKGIDPNKLKMVSNQPVNNQVKTVKKFKLAEDIIKADKRLSEKEKQEFLEWNDKIMRLAEEIKEQERQEEERKRKDHEEKARNQYMDSKKNDANAEDVKYGKFEQICDPEIKNASSAACAMCCFHPKTYLSKFNPDTQVMTDGYIDSRDNQCHCTWQGKPLTGYDTRNTSDQACTAYCLAYPEDTKGFNPDKHQMHYGKLKKGQCQCHYINKDADICSWKVSTKSDDACSRCCMARGANSNNFSVNFDPTKHTMTGGWVRFPGKSIRYCDCTWKTKPEMQADEHAAVTGTSVDAPAPAYGDDAYTTAVCDQNFVPKTHGNCTKCCLAKQPQAPRAGYKLDFGYLNNGRCKCHFSNPNADVCDNERKLASDYGCYKCCEAQPPSGFNPDTDEMDYGRVVGNNCECHWKTRPSSNNDSCYYPYPLADGACEQCVNNPPTTQWECEKCCGYILRPGLYSSQYYTSSPMEGVKPGCICHFSDGKGLGF